MATVTTPRLMALDAAIRTAGIPILGIYVITATGTPPSIGINYNGASGGQQTTAQAMADGWNWATTYNAHPVSPIETCNYRLSLTSGQAIPTSDVTGASTLYAVPFDGDEVVLQMLNPSTFQYEWKKFRAPELSLSLSGLTSGRLVDVYITADYTTSVVQLALYPWNAGTNNRADNPVLLDGIWVRATAQTWRYLGTFKATSTTTTEDSAAKRFLWNANNQVPLPLRKAQSADFWAYNSTSYQQANNSSANQVEVVTGLVGSTIDLSLHGQAYRPVTQGMVYSRIGEDSTTTAASEQSGGSTLHLAGTLLTSHARLVKSVPVGYHKYTWIEKVSVADANTTFFYDGSGDLGLAGWVMG